MVKKQKDNRVAPTEMKMIQQQQLAALQRSSMHQHVQGESQLSISQAPHVAAGSETAGNNAALLRLRKYLRPVPAQLCLAILPCLILMIPLIVFIIQLVSFVVVDLISTKNEIVVNDVYLENLCDPSNLLLKLNITQRWNATFDLYVGQMEMILVDHENEENIFKAEMLPMQESTSFDLSLIHI